MNNIQIWSRETDLKLLRNLATAGIVLFAAFVGALVPMPVQSTAITILYMAISVSLGIFAWGIFNIMKPLYYDKRWEIGEMIVVPLTWILLVSVLALCFFHYESAWKEQIQKGMEMLGRVNVG